MSSPIWLVRHAPVAVSGICYGHADVPTVMDAETAARRVLMSAGGADGNWEEIWSSPSVRTRTVAAVLATTLELPLRIDERLRELHFGSWEGVPYREIEQEKPDLFRRWLDAYETCGPPGGESGADLRHRVEGWVLQRRDAGRPLLAVTHAGVIRSARAFSAGVPYAVEALREVAHLAVERLGAGSEDSVTA